MKILLNSKVVINLILSMFFFLMNPALAADAELPYSDQVPSGEPMAIDGIWHMAALNKKIRIEGGRAYAIDGWMAYIFWEVKPDMVTLQDIKQSAPGSYTGTDLIQKVPMVAKLQANGILKFSAGLFVSDFISVQLDNPEMMAAELQNLGGGNNYAQPELQPDPPSATEPNPTPSDCSQWAIDPETNSPVCMD